jgi:hypothetical protein
MSGYMNRDIFDAIDRAALKKRGTLRAWMSDNRTAFHDRLLTYKPDWPTLARVFTEAGLLDSRGNPPTAEAARKTWYRVQAEKKTKPPPAAVEAKPREVAQPAQQIKPRTGTDILAMLSPGRKLPDPL